MGPIRTIVCGFGTPLMQSRSLHGAVWLARHTGADLHAVFVPTPGMDGCGYGRRYCDLWEEFERTIPRLHERSRMACRFRGDTLEGRVLELAGQVKADLVVMEAPRPEPGHRALAAPGLQALLAHASIPVLIVHVLPVTGLRTLIAGGPAAGEHSFLDLTREVLEPLFGSASAEWRLLDVIGPREDVHLRVGWASRRRRKLRPRGTVRYASGAAGRACSRDHRGMSALVRGPSGARGTFPKRLRARSHNHRPGQPGAGECPGDTIP
jgi:hypothetical protein